MFGKQEQAEKTAFYKVKAQAVIDYNDASQKQAQMIQTNEQQHEHKKKKSRHKFYKGLTRYKEIMLKCPNNNCCTEFSDADIKLHWRTFQEGTCYKCGGQYDWGLDIENINQLQSQRR